MTQARADNRCPVTKCFGDVIFLGLIAEAAVDDRSARGIAAAVSRLVTAGDLPVGSRLPTVRDVARRLGVSPTTVSEAWRSLSRAGAIQTRGRSGSFVAAPVLPRRRLRYAQLGGPVTGVERDYSTGVPDHDLLPAVTESLRRVGDARLTTSYLDPAVLLRWSGCCGSAGRTRRTS